MLQAELDAGTPLDAMAIEDTWDRRVRHILVRGERKHHHTINLTPDLGEGKTTTGT